jgi:hypothetical protein
MTNKEQEITEETPGLDTAEHNIESIRDILMGDQSREFKQRFSALEERLIREVREVREELRATLEPFKQYVRSELASLGSTLSGQDGRIDGQAHSFDSKLLTAEEKTAERLKNLEQELIDRARQLSEEIRRRSETVMTAVQRAMQELDTRKPDRTALAALLAEVAAHLSGEGGAPERESQERSTH